VNQLFTLIGIIYVIFGFLTAVTGVKLGRSILLAESENKKLELQIEAPEKLFETTKFKYNSYLILFHIVALILILFLLEIYPIYIVLVFVGLYMGYLLYRYGHSLRRLSKPIFWVQLLIILILSFVFWSDRFQGLMIGIKMITRAIMVVSVFTAISVELKNPVVKSLMYRKGFSGLYSTLGLASSAVPFLIKNIANSSNTYYNPIKVLRKSILLSDRLLQSFIHHSNNENKLTIISGDVRSGKTTYLKNLINKVKLNDPGIKIGGIIAHGIDKNGERLGFEIEDIMSGDKIVLCDNQPEKGDIKYGRFYFKKAGFDFGHRALQKAIDECEILIIDEIGPLELKGQGWFEDIEKAMEKENLDMYWVVRKSLLEKVLKMWQHKNVEVVSIDN
ncbi:MAG TPA: hypothetical protein ENK91_02905, partial [Bacteroidetes bacterium]|nr:hypothetical protein [Bacteroidota bacterium]